MEVEIFRCLKDRLSKNMYKNVGLGPALHCRLTESSLHTYLHLNVSSNMTSVSSSFCPTNLVKFYFSNSQITKTLLLLITIANQSGQMVEETADDLKAQEGVELGCPV